MNGRRQTPAGRAERARPCYSSLAAAAAAAPHRAGLVRLIELAATFPSCPGGPAFPGICPSCASSAARRARHLVASCKCVVGSFLSSWAMRAIFPRRPLHPFGSCFGPRPLMRTGFEGSFYVWLDWLLSVSFGACISHLILCRCTPFCAHSPAYSYGCPFPSDLVRTDHGTRLITKSSNCSTRRCPSFSGRPKTLCPP